MHQATKLIIVFYLTCYSSLLFSHPGSVDAGQILNQIESSQSGITMPSLDFIPKKQTAEPSSSDIVINLKNIKFTGNSTLSDSEINQFLEQYLNIPLTVEEIKSIPSNLSLFYRRNQLIAEVVLPDQDITDGLLIVEIIEAALGEVVIDSDDSGRIKESYLKKYFMGPRGSELDLKFISERVLIVNQLPGLKVDAQLKAGQQVGSTDVVIQVKESKSFISSISVDNHGSRSTGSQRALASFSLNNPFGVGDQVSLTALKQEGVDYLRTGYSIPVGFGGLRANFNASYLEYDVILRDFDSTKPYGYSSSFGAELTYPISLDAQSKWNSGLGYVNRSFINKTLLGTSSNYDTNVFNANIKGELYDGLFASNAINELRIDLDKGRVNLSDSPNELADAAGADTQGGFNKLTLVAKRTQYLNDDWSIFGKFLYQWADQNLDSSERLFLGGPDGVRAFPLNEGSGDKGYIANIELIRSLPYNFSSLVFYDIGHVQQYVDNQTSSGADIASNNRLTYKGYGFGLSWQGPYASDFKLVWSKRIGENPYPATSGGDQDGSNKDSSVWLRAGIVF